MYSVGIDIGTTKICGVKRNCETGEVVLTEYEDNGAFLPSEHDWEKVQDVETIVSGVFRIVERIPMEDVKSIGVTGQMHGILYVNDEGKAVSNLYTWQDGRGDYIAAEFGCSTGYGSVTDRYNEEHGLIPPDAKVFCTIHDYIVMLLTGRKKPLVHSSDAASFGCYDSANNKFTRDNPRYPETCREMLVAGFFGDIPVSVAIGDNQAGFIGSGCGEDDVLVNVGTGAQVTIISDRSTGINKTVESRPLYDDKYILAGSSLCGGRSYALLEKFYRDIVNMAGIGYCGSMYDRINEMLEEDPETSLKFDNRFSGTRDEGNIRGKVENISTENFTPRDFAAGCVKGIAEELYMIYESMGTVKKGRIIGSGNGIRKNKTLVFFLEKMFGMKLKLSPYREEAACGAAIFGEKCLEILTGSPIFFEKNRVFRVYTGGKLLDEYMDGNLNGEDCFYPEEWIASSVKAINKIQKDEKEGVSRTKVNGLYFDDITRIFRREMVGDKIRGALVKYLDSSVRLPIQAHPDKKFAKEHFNSNFGKEEAWLVLATRPGAKIYYGFKEGVTEETFREAIEKSREDREAPARLLKEFDVSPGDVFFIPAQKVHAIGYGCLILETQEPTDFTIQPEYYCADYEMNEFERFIGLSEEDAYRCFGYISRDDRRETPETVYEDENVRKESLIGAKQTDCFTMNRYILKDGRCIPEEGGCVVAVTEGKGYIYKKDSQKKIEIKRGEYFFLPESCRGKYYIEGRIEFVCCR